MLTNQSIKIETKPKGLDASEFTIRQVVATDEDDGGWRFQAIVRNKSSTDLTDIEYALRYYDSGGRFIGLDEGFSFGSDDLASLDDKSISIDLNIPPSTIKAVFSLKAKKTNFLEKHNFLIFGGALVVTAVLFFLGDVLRR